MYTPKHFATEDLAQMHALMRQHNFATLVTQRDGAPFASHRMTASTTCSCSLLVSGRPASIPCHLARQERQQVPVACWATKTGWPRQGVCFPSLCGEAGARRFAMRSCACLRMSAGPRLSR